MARNITNIHNYKENPETEDELIPNVKFSGNFSFTRYDIPNIFLLGSYLKTKRFLGVSIYLMLVSPLLFQIFKLGSRSSIYGNY